MLNGNSTVNVNPHTLSAADHPDDSTKATRTVKVGRITVNIKSVFDKSYNLSELLFQLACDKIDIVF